MKCHSLDNVYRIVRYFVELIRLYPTQETYSFLFSSYISFALLFNYLFGNIF